MNKAYTLMEKLIIPILLAVLSFLLNSFSNQVDGLRKEIKELTALHASVSEEVSVLKVRFAIHENLPTLPQVRRKL